MPVMVTGGVHTHWSVALEPGSANGTPHSWARGLAPDSVRVGDSVSDTAIVRVAVPSLPAASLAV